MNKLIQLISSRYCKENYFKLIIFSLFWMFSATSVSAQTYKKHYIAPAPWQYFTVANELIVSTVSTTPITVTVKKSDGTLITTLNNVVAGTPAKYRFSGAVTSFPYFNLNTNINAAGLIVESSSAISVNIRNVASDESNDDYIKGNSSLFSFGDAAIGNKFRVGYYRDGEIYTSNNPNYSTRQHRPVYSVMAIENSTVISINGVATTTLNAGQSYLFTAAMGSLVETSGPAVMNTSGQFDAPTYSTACYDGASNPVPPITALGNEYVVVRGAGNNIAEQTTVVASEANTSITVYNFNTAGVLQSTNTYNLIAAGSFVTFPNGIEGAGNKNNQDGQIYSSSRIVSNKNVVAYSGTAQNCEVDVATLAPISSCGGSKRVETVKFRDLNESRDLPYFSYIILQDPNAVVWLSTDNGYTNKNIETIAGVGLRRQMGSTGQYIIDFDNDEIGNPNVITLSSTSRLTVNMVQQGGGFSMSNFLSPFPEKALKPTFTQTDCASALLTADPSSVAPFQWYLDGVAIAGATNNTYVAPVSGTYTVTSKLDCGMSAQSLPITVALCNVDLIAGKTVSDPSPGLGTTVAFTVTVKNSNVASGTVTGTGNAIGVSATDLLPAGYSYVSSTASTGTSYNPSTGLWSIGAMAAGETKTLTINAKVVSSSVTDAYKNTVTVTGPQSDPVLNNNTASATVTPANISLYSGNDAQVICKGSAITSIVYQLTGNPVSAVVSNLPAGTNGNYDAGTKRITITGTPTVPATGSQTYTYTVTANYGASSITTNGKITVVGTLGTPVFARGTTSVRCEGPGVESYVATAANSNSISYSIAPSGAGVINSATGEVTWSASYNGTATITASATNTCGTQTANHTVTVTSTGTITGSATQCSGSNGTLTLTGAPATVVRWESSTDNGISWTPIANTTTTLNYTNIAVTTMYRAIVSGNGCTNAISATATVTVTPRPVIADQTYYICKTGSFSFSPVYAPNGTTYTWSAPVLSSSNITGGTAGTGQSAINQSLTNSGTTLQTATYTVTPTYSSCAGNTFTITVYVVPTLTASATGTTICSSSAFSVMPNSNVNGTTYAWTAALTNGTASGFSNQSTSTAGPISQTLLNTSGADATVRYTVTPFFNGCSGASFTFDVIVKTATPAPTATNQTFCEISNATVADLLTTSGTNIKWYNTSTGGTALAPTAALTNGTYYASQTTNGCESTVRAQITVSITATPAPTAGNQTFCEIANATVANLVTTSGTNIKWYSTSTGGTALAPTTALSSGTYYASQTANSCESTNRTMITVTIYSTPKGFNDTKTLDCTGIFNYNLQTANIDNTTNGGNAVPASFTWTVNSNSNVAGAANGSGNTINQILINNSNAAQTITYTVTPKATGAGACVGNTFTIIVNVPVCSSISITKIADVANVNQVGNTINYTVAITNTGNASQTNVVVNDPLLGGALLNPVKTGNADNILDKGEIWTYSGSYTVTQVDLNNNGKPVSNSGKITNTASVQTTELPTAKTATAEVNITLSPAVTLVKTSVLNLNGNTINYIFTVKNTGNVTLSNLVVTDSKVSGPITLTATTLAPGASTTATATYTISAAEKALGAVSNTAIVTGKNPLNGDVTDVSGTTASNDTPTLTATGVYAVDDAGTLNAVSGGVAVANVLVNDKVNGNQASLTNVTITQVSSSNPNISIDPATGEVKVLPNTPVGDYTLIYQIEDKANPGNVKQATVTVHLVTGALLAKDNAGSANSVTGGTAITNVLSNDSYNGTTTAPTLADVTITNGTNDSNGKVTLDPATGSVSVAANTPAGVYTLTYTITDKLDASKTSTTTVKVTVASGAILAKDDAGSANSVTGGTAVANVLSKDNYNGTTTAPTLADVTITNGTNDSNGKVTLDPATGSVSVAANTPAGVYTLTYTITDKLDASKTSTATVKVTVASGAILAKDDAGSANSVTGGTAVANVLANDNYNGTTTAPTLADVTITNGTNDSNGKVTLDPATGSVSVAANTPAGIYTLTYTITDKLDASKTSTATVKVTVASGVILAKDDAGTANSVTGGTAVANVLANDNYNGTTTAPTLADVTITNGTNDSNGKVTLDAATGSVSVAANTPAGIYTLTYTITDKLDASKTSTATVKVTVASGALLAKDDAGSANSVTGGTVVANVLSNDNYNGTTTAPTLADVTITNGTNDSNGKVTLDPATGSVSVAANTPAGVYTLTYTITDKLDASKTSTATVKVTVASGAILAKDDAGTANSVTGGTAITNVLSNDNYNGTTTAPTLADVTITNGTNDSNGKVTLDLATGSVSVAANTPAGIYTLIYTITDKLDASKTSTATVKVTVASGLLLAKDDAGTANSVTGGTAVANVLANDNYNGTTTAPTLADVSITNGTNDSNGKVTLDPATGSVSVAANTPAGVYTLTYIITDKLDASKTSTATVKVTVASGAILAKDDAGTANSVTGGTAVANVLANDNYNGTATAPTLADVTISNGTNDSNGKVTLDPATGSVSVAANTPAGIYTLTYTITDKLDASKTSTATVKVTVASGLLLAKDDAGTANSVTGGTAVANVLSNDNYNGTATAPTLADVTITNGTNDSNGKVTLDPATGSVSVAANTPAGVYTLTYTITDKLDASKTSTATVKVTVASGAILAKDDAGTANSVTGGTAVANVLTNDNYNGTATAPTLADVTITNGTNDSNGKVTLDPATGSVRVAANTPAGVYTLTYTITDKLDASKTSTATVKVTVASGAILAKDDAGSANSVTGGTAVANVLANDNYNGTTTAPTLADVTITNGTNDSNGKVTLDPATGSVSVAANTPAGVYTLTYTITDKLDASKTSTATVKVTVASGAILAKDDAGSANSVTGGTAVANVLANDNYNGTTTAPTLADVTITNGTNDSNGKVTLDPATGSVSVAANTPAGVYTLTYTITDKLDASKTSTATVKVTVASGAILAKDDAGTANSVTGGTAVANVLANDNYNGTTTAPTLADVTITNGTNDSNGKVTLDPATGSVSVAANTPAGVYTLTYTITDKLDASKTSTATVKVTVASGLLLAKDDAGTANSVTGGTAVANVLVNDNYNGTTTAPTLADVTITNGTNDSNGKVTLDPAAGSVSVDANTPAGVYTLTYTITDKLDASKTSTATVKVTVASGAILAKDDAGIANSVTGGTAVANVLANDNYNGTTSAPTLNDVTINNGTNDSNGKVTLDPATGSVSVAANTPAGIYTLTYTITDKLDASKTSTATVKVTVASGAILAKDDAGSANSVTGGTAVANVLTNDNYNGTTTAPTLADVTITNGTNDSNGKVTLDPATGSVSVAANTPAGVYTLTYTITDKLDASKTSTATVKVTVASGAILAKDDAGTANSVTGGTAVANVLSNDNYNGTATAPTLADVTINNGTNDSNGKVTLDPATGSVSVATNTPAGVYTLTYTITDKLDVSKTSTATVKVTVASGAILAKDDAGSANSVTGGTAVANVLANDNYNGTTTAPTLADVTITNGTNDSNGKVTLDPATGSVSVAANTPAGVYTLTYTITDKLDASKTSTATVKVTVASGAILAKDDAGTANSVTGGTAVANVLTNDNYNGTATAPTLADVTITNGTNDSNGKVTLDPATGSVSVAANTPSGVYTLTYIITDKLDASKTSTATVKVTVASGALLAKDDAGSANSVTGGTAVANVLTNDNYNGTATAPTLADVTITNGTNDSNGKVTLDAATGSVSVAANTPAGIYTLTYTITDKLDASKTSTATVKVTVASGAILAKDDAGSANSVTGGTVVANVLSNDNYNGTTTAPTLADVTITNGMNDSNGKVTLDPATGSVSVAANTPAGVYTLTYTITDKLDASKTSTATIKVTVASGAILAKDDAGTANSVTGGTAVANVLANDNYNGTTSAPTLNDVTITNGTNDSNGKVTLDPVTGSVSVAANTPAGIYTLTYTITDKLDASKTSTATVKVPVATGLLLAKDDAGNANGLIGGVAVDNVLSNDGYNGTLIAPTLNEVNLSQVSTTHPNVTLDVTTGKVNVAPNTPAGSYTLVYQIEDKLNPGQTKTATVTITVGAPVLAATNDSGNANGFTGGTAVTNVLDNDTYNGNPVTLNEVKLSQVSTTHPNVTLDVTTGKVNVAPNTPAGSYTLVYQIEDKLNPGQTKTATVTITVGAPVLAATNDSGNANGFTGGTAVTNVLDNDTYNGNPVTLNEVNLSQVSTTHPNVTLDVTTGKVNVAPNTPAGSYTLVYQIEDKLNPGQTKTATVTITVGAPVLAATNDSGNANGFTGGTAVTNVLDNDTYNGNPVTLNEVKLSQVSTTHPNVTLDVTTGKVNVAPNTPAGSYTLIYQIEDKLNPGQTKTATVTITVGTNTILAKDDVGTANGFTGGVAIENILVNDQYNDVSTAAIATVIINQISTSNPKINIDAATGKVNVAAGTLPGVYTLTYQITDKLSVTKTSTAVVTVNIPNWITDLQVSKTANVAGIENNGNISYTITIKNNGPATVLSGESVGLIENLPAGLENISYTAIGGTYSSTGKTFTLSADLLAGQQVSLTVNARVAATFTGAGLVNSVSLSPTATSTDPDQTNNQSTVTTSLLKGKIALIKTGILSADGNNITYAFKITNVGDVELSGIVLTDAKLGLNKTFPNVLAVGANFTYSQVYTLSQSDKDAGIVTNTAAVSSKTPVGNAITDISGTDYSNDNPTETPVSGSPKLTFTKIASAAGTKIGESINYTFTVTNTGSVTLNNLTVTDAAVDAGSINPSNISTLVPGASVTVTAKHTLTQDDINLGSFTNQALIKLTDNKGNLINQLSDDPSTPAPNDATVTQLIPSPGFTLTKSATNSATKAGDVINYNIAFKNTGNVTLTNIELVDANADAGSLTPSNIASVLPGATVNITAKHTVKQSDVNAGGFSNQVSASAKDPKGNTIAKVSDDPSTPATDDATFSQIMPNPSVRFTKVFANAAGVVKVIEYSIQVTNTGNVTLTDIVVTDEGADAGSIKPAMISKLEPSETALILARHTLTQPEIDNGRFVNQANLVARYSGSNKLSKLSDDPRTVAPDDPTIFLIKEAPGLTLVKTGVLSADGNSVTYTFTAKNTGNVTLNNFSLLDPKISSTLTFSPASIAPEETAVATAVYTITQAEKNASSVRNTATLTAKTPGGASISDISGTDEDNDYPTILELPKIVSSKSVVDANNNGKAEANEVLTYTITVKNNGNTARTGVKITDPIPVNTTYLVGSANNGAALVGNALSWNNLSIPANAQVQVSFKVTVNAVIPSGILSVSNTATVTDPANTLTPLSPSVSIPTEGMLEGSKSVADNKGNKDGKAQANEILTYSLQVRNTGGSALNGVTITDELPAGLTYVPNSISGYGTVTGNTLNWKINMQANSSTVLTFDAKVATDVNSYNTIKNVAVMTSATGTTIRPEVLMDIDKSADLVITKELLTKGDIKTGDDVTYKITVTNKGPNRATGVTVTDKLSTIIDAPKEITVTVGTTSYTATSRDLEWLVGSLALNQSATLTFKARTLASGTLNNSASVKADQPDPISNNNLVKADAAIITGSDLLIPNLFTPNGDGINDTFEINGLAEFAENDLTIVNRWGNEVFRAKGYQNNWTGEGLNEGTYYYLLRARKGGSSEWKVFKGYITLIRAFKN